MTPLDFLDASSDTLRRFVFHSINGEHWYNRLHGWEPDDFETKLGNVGRQFVMDKATSRRRGAASPASTTCARRPA
jgi:hypothetical protein